MELVSLLASNNYIIYNKLLAKLIGRDEAIMLGELISEYNYWKAKDEIDEFGYFYSTVENIEENILFTAYEQRKILNKLSEIGLVETVIKGMPAKRYIKINQEQVIKVFDIEELKNLTASDKEIKEQDIKEFDTNNNNIINNKNNNKNNNKEEMEKFQTTYNSICIDLPKIQKLTDRRISAIKKYLKEFDFETFERECKLAQESDFISGRSGKWQSSFDWLIKIDNATKVLEGNYKNKNKSGLGILSEIYQETINQKEIKKEEFSLW